MTTPRPPGSSSRRRGCQKRGPLAGVASEREQLLQLIDDDEDAFIRRAAPRHPGECEVEAGVRRSQVGGRRALRAGDVGELAREGREGVRTGNARQRSATGRRPPHRRANAGMTPAWMSELLPLPDAPTTARKRALRRRSTTRATSPSRPKKSAACSSSNASRPRYGHTSDRVSPKRRCRAAERPKEVLLPSPPRRRRAGPPTGWCRNASSGSSRSARRAGAPRRYGTPCRAGRSRERPPAVRAPAPSPAEPTSTTQLLAERTASRPYSPMPSTALSPRWRSSRPRHRRCGGHQRCAESRRRSALRRRQAELSGCLKRSSGRLDSAFATTSSSPGGTSSATSDSRGGGVLTCAERGDLVANGERGPPGERVEQDAAQRVDVGSVRRAAPRGSAPGRGRRGFPLPIARCAPPWWRCRSR